MTSDTSADRGARSSGEEQQEQTPTQSIIEIAKEKEETEQKLKEVEPDTEEEARLWGKQEGLKTALKELEKLHDRQHFPEWNIGVENDSGEWEWYYPRAIHRESAIEQARDQAKDDLGGTLNVYEVGGPIAA
jgi:hypothetical protein